MISERSRTEWEGFARARASAAAPFLDSDRLFRFLVGLHLRGEELTAHELKELLDGTGLGEGERRDLTAFVEAALGMLAAYDAVLGEDRPGHGSGASVSGDEV